MLRYAKDIDPGMLQRKIPFDGQHLAVGKQLDGSHRKVRMYIREKRFQPAVGERLTVK